MLIAALAVALAMFAAPAVASAATQVSVQQVEGLDVVVAVDDDGPSQIDTTLGIEEGTAQHFVAVQSAGGATPGAGCQVATATIVGCPGDFDAIVVFGNGGNDTITLDLIADGLPPLHGEAYGAAGDDTLRSPPDFRDVPQPETYIEGEGGNDTIVSGNGPDELLGGDGNDTMQSFEGPDVVRGEGGDDSVSAGKEEPEANAADVVDGGPGFDAIPDVDADYNRGFDDNVSVTLDGQANDGEASEGDNVIAVEKLRVTADQATVVGSDAADDFFVEANGSTIRGLGGNDRLIAYDGNDSIEGGDGDDFLEGGFGNDVLDGGAGVDQFQGDRLETDVFAVGNDQIRARDGASEQVSCGIGADTAQVDPSDVVDSSCESVDPGPSGFKVGLKPRGRLPRLGVALRRGLTFAVETDRAGRVVVELLAKGKFARGVAARTKVVARGSKRATGAGTVKVKVRFKAKAKRRYRKLHKLTLTARATVTDSGGARGVKTRKLVLKR